ncbi:MAG: hypothetical protein ACM3ZQ_00085 [Bacillota bacterium]
MSDASIDPVKIKRTALRGSVVTQEIPEHVRMVCHMDITILSLA